MTLLAWSVVGIVIFYCLGTLRNFFGSLPSFLIRDVFCLFSLIPGILESNTYFVYGLCLQLCIFDGGYLMSEQICDI